MGRDVGSGILLLAVLGIVKPTARDSLSLDVRRRIHDCVLGNPGTHLREIGRLTGLEPNHAKYHLIQLEKHGRISSRRGDGYWRFWPRDAVEPWRGEVPPRVKDMVAALRKPVPLHVTRVLLELEATSHGQLQPLAGVSSSTLHYHLRRMESCGLVVSGRVGRERHYRLQDPDLVVQLMTQYCSHDDPVNRPTRPSALTGGAARETPPAPQATDGAQQNPPPDAQQAPQPDPSSADPTPQIAPGPMDQPPVA